MSCMALPIAMKYYLVILVLQEGWMVPVILSGGSGARLWPASQKHSPKPFLRLFSDHSLLQETLLRLSDTGCSEPVIVCNEAHRFIVAEHCRALNVSPQAILLEPFARNTAPAVALAANYLLSQGVDEPMLILPADHQMAGGTLFKELLDRAAPLARQGNVVTFGVTPRYAETNYGYIRLGVAKNGSYSIQQFIEKPDKTIAERFLQEGGYLWNSGLFMVTPSTYLKELSQKEPKTGHACALALKEAVGDQDFVRVASTHFADASNVSIDYAIMETTDLGRVIPFQGHWSDVGTWSSIKAGSSRDEAGNSVQGPVIDHDCSNSYFRSDKLLVAIGLDNVIVVETEDGLLISAADRAGELTLLLPQLERTKPSKEK